MPAADRFTISWYFFYCIVGIAVPHPVAQEKPVDRVRVVRGRFRPKWFSPNGPLNGPPPPRVRA
jgi:hypothetical protein